MRRISRRETVHLHEGDLHAVREREAVVEERHDVLDVDAARCRAQQHAADGAAGVLGGVHQQLEQRVALHPVGRHLLQRHGLCAGQAGAQWGEEEGLQRRCLGDH